MMAVSLKARFTFKSYQELKLRSKLQIRISGLLSGGIR